MAEWFSGRSISTGGTVGGRVWWVVNLYWGDSWWKGLVGGHSLLGDSKLLVEWFGGRSISAGGTVGGMVWWAVNLYWGTVGRMVRWAVNLYWGDSRGNGWVGLLNVFISIGERYGEMNGLGN